MNPPVDVVFVVAYGDGVHVYGPDDEEAANTLHAVGVAAFGDGDIHRVPADTWSVARERLRGQCPVIDHRS